jgi:DNA-binding MarR family transcriptional regulator
MPLIQMYPAAVSAAEAIDSSHRADLTDAVLGLQRAIRRATRSSLPNAPLPPSEAELLVFVSRHPGASVSEAAAALQLAPNTVSTLVGKLALTGLLDRRDDPRDRRATKLVLRSLGRARVRQWRQHRDRIVLRALAALDHEDRDALHAALGPLHRLSDVLARLDG